MPDSIYLLLQTRVIQSISYYGSKNLGQHGLQSEGLELLRFLIDCFLSARMATPLLDPCFFVILHNCDFSIGQFSNAMTLTQSEGHGDADDFILFIIIISWQDGVSRLKPVVGFPSKMDSEMIYDCFSHLKIIFCTQGFSFTVFPKVFVKQSFVI